MTSPLSPREIQARVRAGASAAEIVDETGMSAERVDVFAGPVLAERAHMARLALAATVRRRGDGSGHRRLAEVVSERLGARGIDADQIVWDTWRRADLKWQVVGVLADEAAPRRAEFVFDVAGRFSVTDNADARWMIGEQLPGHLGPDNENTIDFDDELALVRAIAPVPDVAAETPGDDVPAAGLLQDEMLQTSELDDLYDMMSGISEDSVRIYTGLDDIPQAGPAATESTADAPDAATDDEPAPTPTPRPEAAPEPEPAPDALLPEPRVEPGAEPVRKARPTRRGRAKVPSWDEIMFGGKGS